MSQPTNSDPYFLQVPYAKRWGHLQSIIVGLYINNTLGSNVFSNVDVTELPVAVTRNNPATPLTEGIAFAIMAGNPELLCDILERKISDGIELNLTSLYPFHLATTFLNGLGSCCNILNDIICDLGHGNSIQKLYINDRGHTVLDNLMMTILRSHTSCSPDVVDDTLKNWKRFPGEEIDICGPPQDDSPCLRANLGAGRASIPLQWKHMFCHTSAQAVCHPIGCLFGPDIAADINIPSGRCGNCDLKLPLLPLHTLVFTATHLTQSGYEGETLFGMVACLTCFLANGADPSLEASISLAALTGNDVIGRCTHEELNSIEFLDSFQSSLSARDADANLGWAVFRSFLRYATEE